ncbi:MAG: aspartate decarboxylase [Pseudomonadota bacterium]|mgnify:CR=1 FL=1
MSISLVGSKANPSKFDCYSDLAADEPYFVIRADDPLSDSLIELHAYIGAGQSGAAHNKLAEIMALTSGQAPRPSDSPKYRETFAISQAMEAWRSGRMKKAG